MENRKIEEIEQVENRSSTGGTGRAARWGPGINET